MLSAMCNIYANNVSCFNLYSHYTPFHNVSDTYQVLNFIQVIVYKEIKFALNIILDWMFLCAVIPAIYYIILHLNPHMEYSSCGENKIP